MEVTRWQTYPLSKWELTMVWHVFLLPLFSYLGQFWSPTRAHIITTRRLMRRILRLSVTWPAQILTFMDLLTTLPAPREPELWMQATMARASLQLQGSPTHAVDAKRLGPLRYMSIDWQ